MLFSMTLQDESKSSYSWVVWEIPLPESSRPAEPGITLLQKVNSAQHTKTKAQKHQKRLCTYVLYARFHLKSFLSLYMLNSTHNDWMISQWSGNLEQCIGNAQFYFVCLFVVGGKANSSLYEVWQADTRGLDRTPLWWYYLYRHCI